MVAGDPGVGKTALADAIGAEAVAAGATVLWGRAWGGGGAPSYWPWLRILRRLSTERDIAEALAALGPEATGRLTRLVPASRARRALSPTAPTRAPPDRRRRVRRRPLSALRRDHVAAARRRRAGAARAHPRRPARRRSPVAAAARLPRRARARLADPRHRHLPRGRGAPGRAARRDARRHHPPRPAAAAARAARGRRRRGRRARRGPPPARSRRARDPRGDRGQPVLRRRGRAPAERRGPPRRRRPRRRRAHPRRRARDDPPPPRAAAGRHARAAVHRRGHRPRVSPRHPAARQRRRRRPSSTRRSAPRSAAACSSSATSALGAYSFSHGLIRETLYDDLGPQRRGPLHREVGLALEELYGADPEPHVAELAHHFFVAATTGELEKAIDYSVRAGERALELIAYEEASAHFERALQAYALQERADVAAPLRAAARARHRAVALGRVAAPRARRSCAPPTSRAGSARPSAWRARRSATARAWAASSSAASTTGSSRCSARRARRSATRTARCTRACSAGWRPSCTSPTALEERVALADERRRDGAPDRRPGDARLDAERALPHAAGARELRRAPADRRRTSSRSGEEVRDRELVLRGHVWRILSLMELGDWVGAEIELAVHARLADELRDPLHLWYVPLFAAARALLQGRLDEAEHFAARGVRDRPRVAGAERRPALRRPAVRAARRAGPPDRGRAVAGGVRPPLSGRAGLARGGGVRAGGARARRRRAAALRRADRERRRRRRDPARRRVAGDRRAARAHAARGSATAAAPARSARCWSPTPSGR